MFSETVTRRARHQLFSNLLDDCKIINETEIRYRVLMQKLRLTWGYCAVIRYLDLKGKAREEE